DCAVTKTPPDGRRFCLRHRRSMTIPDLEMITASTAGWRHCRFALFGSGRFLPTTTHGLEQIDLAGQLRQTIANQLLLNGVQLALSVQQRQIVIDSSAVAPLSEPVIILTALEQATLGLNLAGIGFLGREAVSDFAERGLNRLLVFSNLDVLADPLIVQIGSQLTGIKDRHADAG